MINVDKIKVADFLEYAEAAKIAYDRVMRIRQAIDRQKDNSLADQMVLAHLTPEEQKFARKYYYIASESDAIRS